MSLPNDGDPSLPDGGTARPVAGDIQPPRSTPPLSIEDAEYFSMLDAIGQNTTDLIAIIDSEGLVVYGNPIAQKFFGVTIEEAVGTRARLYLHPDDLEQNLKFFAEVVQTAGSSARQEIRTMSP